MTRSMSADWRYCVKHGVDYFVTDCVPRCPRCDSETADAPARASAVPTPGNPPLGVGTPPADAGVGDVAAGGCGEAPPAAAGEGP